MSMIPRVYVCALALVIAFGLAASPAAAQTIEELRQQIEILSKRLDEL